MICGDILWKGPDQASKTKKQVVEKGGKLHHA